MKSVDDEGITIELPNVHIEVPVGYRIEVHTLADGSQSITIEPP
jgi:hypothetical protein